jgi:hypothetical protein
MFFVLTCEASVHEKAISHLDGFQLLKAHHKIVSIADDNDIALCHFPAPDTDPVGSAHRSKM